ncbi:MAG: hypothetical protein JRN23_02440 [Nitrososphaerota archaeon]|nr:hypothetical protein [Nitrososphaerota archaeon]MDG6967515.1 hypothetical protein [Nitrososphaerota archaeon]MDG6978940.1 hypothetical protein [Nitrososphaerota archaeon]MDG7020774.1 hypothetical protein [Nitrososphaerota archaeon]
MQVNAGKLQILTVAAMLVLISGGIAAYAQNQTSSSSSSSTTSSSASSSASSTSATANYTLCQSGSAGRVGRLELPITAVGQAANGGAVFSEGRGCVASITATGGVFSVQVALRSAKPLTQYNVVLVANGTSHTLGNMVTGQTGNGQMDNQVLLTNGTYVVSIQIYDTSSSPGQSTLVLQTGQGTITSQPFSTTAAGQQPQPPAQGGHGDQHDQGQWPSGHW